MTKTATLALVLLALVALISPQQLPVIIYKVGLVLLAGVAGYILDRALFPYGRPDRFNPWTKAAKCWEESGERNWPDKTPAIYVAMMARRALIVAAAMLAVGLGL
jgi:hypothetical protein